MSAENQESQEKEMSFLDHLEELRWHIIRSLVSVVVFAILVFVFKEFVFDKIIFAPKKDSFLTYQIFCAISERTCFSPPEFDIIAVQFGERFFTHLKVSFWLGVVASFPYISWEVWKFIKPGLYSNEQKAAKGIVMICSILFIIGVLFGYFIIAPFAIKILGGYSLSQEEVVSSTSLASYVNYLTMFSVPTGIIFEMPVIVYFLAKVGLISASFMKKYRRHAVVVILIFAAIITPPDVVTQFLIGIPVYILYEISIIIAKRVYPNP